MFLLYVFPFSQGINMPKELCFHSPFHPGSIPEHFLSLTPNISVTVPAYTKSFSSVIFPTSILFITSSSFLVASNNLCFSIHHSGGNFSLVSFESTLRIFSSMVISSFVICIFIFITKTCFFPPQHLISCKLLARLHILLQTHLAIHDQIPRTIPHLNRFPTSLHHY